MMAHGKGKGEVGSPSNPVPTKREVGGFKPSKVPKSYISRELTAMSRLGRKVKEIKVC